MKFEHNGNELELSVDEYLELINKNKSIGQNSDVQVVKGGSGVFINSKKKLRGVNNNLTDDDLTYIKEHYNKSLPWLMKRLNYAKSHQTLSKEITERLGRNITQLRKDMDSGINVDSDKKKDDKKKERVNLSYDDLSYDDVVYIKVHCNKSMVELKKDVGYKGSVSQFYYDIRLKFGCGLKDLRQKMGFKRIVRKQRKKRKPNFSDGFRNNLAVRGKFVMTRAKWYCNQYRWDMGKAMRQASSDWKHKKGLGGILTPSVDKLCLGLTDDGVKMFKDMLRVIIKEGGYVGLRDVSCLPRVDGKDWDIKLYREFILSVLTVDKELLLGNISKSGKLCINFGSLIWRKERG